MSEREPIPLKRPSTSDRRHRNSHSTSHVPELWKRVNRNAAPPSPAGADADDDDAWFFAGPHAAETASLRADAAANPRIHFGVSPTPRYASLLYGALHGDAPPTPPAVRVSRRRWLMLAYLSLLALLSDWICFSAAPIAPLVRRNFQVHDALLVTCFLSTNVVFCLIEPSVLKVAGLRLSIVGGAVAMAAGCVLRCVASEISTSAAPEGLTIGQAEAENGELGAPAYLVIAGTMLVGAAQPFFQCTPSLLAANWFGESETTLAATLALNSNQLGIALAYAVGAGLVRTDADLARYFRGLAALGCLLALGCALHFKSLPKRAPSAAQLAQLKRASDLEERRRTFEALRRAELGGGVSRPADGALRPSDSSTASLARLERLVAGRPLARWLVTGHQVGHGALALGKELNRAAAKLWASSGFRGGLVAFVGSIATSNLVSAFLPHLVYEGEGAAVDMGLVRKQHKSGQATRVAALGAAFQVAILAGSLAFGAYVDHSKRYKAATAFAFVGTVVALGFLADGAVTRGKLDAAVLCLGLLVGPIQPLSAELAVEATYPDGDENTIVALMQTAGNGLSALAVPAFLALSRFARERQGADARLRAEYLVLAVLNGLALLAFVAQVRHAPLLRAAHNSAANSSAGMDGSSRGVSPSFGPAFGEGPPTGIEAELRRRSSSTDDVPRSPGFAPVVTVADDAEPGGLKHHVRRARSDGHALHDDKRSLL